MRQKLNGSINTIGGIGGNLSNKNYIKQVKKQCIAKEGISSTTVNYVNDFLWLLACSEIYPKENNMYACADAAEGEQYQFYKAINPNWTVGNEELIRRCNSTGFAYDWWLRSPFYRKQHRLL